MAKKKGSNLIVYIGNKLLGCATTCELDESCDVKEVASPESGEWREYVSGRKGWKISSGYILSDTNGNEVHDLIGKTVNVSFGTAESIVNPSSNRVWDGDVLYKGRAIITRLTITGKRGDMATMSMELQGTGELTNDNDSLIYLTKEKEASITKPISVNDFKIKGVDHYEYFAWVMLSTSGEQKKLATSHLYQDGDTWKVSTVYTQGDPDAYYISPEGCVYTWNSTTKLLEQI